MGKKTRSYSAEFKQEAVRRMAHAKTITGLAEELGIRRKFLYQWRHQFEAEGRAGLERRRGRPPGSKSQNVSPPGRSAAEWRIAGRDPRRDPRQRSATDETTPRRDE